MISDNSAVRRGGGIYSCGTLTATDSTVSDNTAREGGGIATITDDDAMTASVITGCFVTGNTSQGGGGGIFNDDEMLMVNSIIAGNQLTQSDGAGFWHNDTATVTNCTITGNTAAAGGGGIRTWDWSNVTLVINNTIVAQNSSSPDIKMHIAGCIQGSNNLTTFTDWNNNSGSNIV